MTEQETDAIIGKAVRDYKENDRALRILVARANHIGQKLCALGDILQKHPFGVVTLDDGLRGGDVVGDSSLSSFADVLNYDALLTLENEVRTRAAALRKARTIRDSVC
jgi:hypothetical protein